MGSVCTKRPITASNKNSNNTKLNPKLIRSGNYKEKYDFISILGNGAFGKVRLYNDKKLKNMKFAIKTMKKENISSTLLGYIYQEISILSELDHPNIVKYYETYEDDYYIHIVMEYLQGEDLFKVISTKKYNHFTENDASEIIKNLLRALSFIHNKGIVHRDIKPQNILFSHSGDYSTLKIIDFGLSTHKKPGGKQRVGSPYYMAPEIIDGFYSTKTDLWSVGIILFVMITGSYPYEAKSQHEIFVKIQNEDYNRSLLDDKKCSNEVKDLINNLLKKQEYERYGAEQALEHNWFKQFKNPENLIIDNEILLNLKEFTKKNLLQKEILYYIAKISKDDELVKLKNAFEGMDKDHTGTLEREEILNAFKNLGIEINITDVEKIWSGLDFHNDGSVNYTEFLAATISTYNFQKEEKLWAAFKYFDYDNTGYVTSDNVIEGLKSQNLAFDEKEIQKVFNQREKTKRLDFEEFKKFINIDN